MAEDLDDAALSLIAHNLRGAIGIAAGAARTVCLRRDRLDDERRNECSSSTSGAWPGWTTPWSAWPPTSPAPGNAVINLLAPVRHVVATTGVYRTSTLARWLRDVWCRSARPERTTGHTGLPLAM